MKVTKGKAERLKFFRDLYEEAKMKTSEQFELLERHLKQYEGDASIEGGMDAEMVRNITYELLESQVSSYIPRGKVEPVYAGERGHRNARSIEALLGQIRDRLPFEEMNDMDERYTYVYGGSVWLVEWDESITSHSTVGGVKVTNISPQNFVPQPGVYNVQDMEYCFITFTSTKEELVRKYGVKWDVAEAAQNDEDMQAEDTATEFVCYYRDEAGRLCQFVWSDEVVLLDLENYYSRKRKYCRACGKREQLCGCDKPQIESRDEEFELLEHPIVLSDGSVIPMESPAFDERGQPVMEEVEVPVMPADGAVAMGYIDTGIMLPMKRTEQRPVMEQTKLPFYTPSLLPIVVRKNISQEKSVLGQSDCAAIRPQQIGVNKVESRIMQKLLRAGITPVLPEDATVSLNNSVFGNVIKLRPGESRDSYGTLDNTPNITQDIAEAERLYDQAKRILGITNSFQGQADASAQSGYAKQIQVNQAAGRLDSKRRMKNAAYASIDSIVFQFYLAYADEPRPVSYIDAFGRRQEVSFNRYDFLICDEAGEWYYDDEYTFSADASADVNQNRELLWQINEKNFASGTYGDPALPETQLNYWLNMAEARYPYARENVERIKAQIQRQAKMAAMQAELESRKEYEEYLQSEGNALSEELESRKGYETYLQDEGNRLAREVEHISAYEDFAKR